MAMLAIGAVGAGLVQIPKVDFVIDDFLRPTSQPRRCTLEPHTRSGLLCFGLVLGTVLGLAGIAIAYRVWVAQAGHRCARARASARRCMSCSCTSGTSTS